MSSIGERLRQERLRRGLDLFRIAEQTKINPALLEAIESDDLDKLPGSFFTRSFVRQYAKALGLDENEFEPELHRVTEVEQEPPALRPFQRNEFDFTTVASAVRPSVPRSIGSLIAFVLIVAACSAAYVLWQRAHEAPRAAQTAPATAAGEQAPAASSVTPAGYRAPGAAPAPEQSPAAPTSTPVTEPVPATLSAVAAGQSAAVRVEVRANAEVWIRVVADGQHLFSGTLEPNQSRIFEASATVLLVSGNAGAMEVLWNGKSVPPLGSQGQVREIQFTPEAFKIVPPSPPKPEVSPSPPEPGASPAEDSNQPQPEVSPDDGVH